MIFVDTGAWIALTDVSDHYHQEAVHIYTRLKQEKAHFVTTDYVLGESVTRLRYDAGHHIAIQFLDALIQAQEARILQTIHIEKSLFDQAVTIFRQYDSAVLSFTDCVSFVVCKQHKIQEAFAFDQHFTMMGMALCSP